MARLSPRRKQTKVSDAIAVLPAKQNAAARPSECSGAAFCADLSGATLADAVAAPLGAIRRRSQKQVHASQLRPVFVEPADLIDGALQLGHCLTLLSPDRLTR